MEKGTRFITRLQIVQLHNWMEKNRDIVPVTQAQALRERATKELGFHIAYSAIADLRKEMGLSPRDRVKVKVSNPNQVLANAIITLFKEQGLTPSVDLHNLANECG